MCLEKKIQFIKHIKNLKIWKSKRIFQNNIVSIDKNIPEFAGLGGGSSNCACFINMVNEACNLMLSKDELAKLVQKLVQMYLSSYMNITAQMLLELVKLLKNLLKNH